MVAAAVIAALSLGVNGAASGITLSLLPAVQTPTVGVPFDVELEISGLTATDPSEVLSAYGLSVTYDASLLQATGIDFGSYLGGPVDSFPFPDWTTTAGAFTVNETSFLTDDDLRALQSDSFVLATLHFTGTNEGTAPFGIDQGFSLAGQVPSGSSLPNDLTSQTQAMGAQVITQPQQAIPEPTTLALISAGLLASCFTTRRRQGRERASS
jgi:hypothetical protein